MIPIKDKLKVWDMHYTQEPNMVYFLAMCVAIFGTA